MTTAEGVANLASWVWRRCVRVRHPRPGGGSRRSRGLRTLLGRMGSPGKFSLWYRLTVGLRKREGQWRIAHTHASVPFYMDESGRAALDLAP